MIYKFQPFAIDKSKFGDEINAHCAIVPSDDDWILILDYDCQIASPLAYQVIERAIERYPDTAVFGAMTNRVAHSFQMLQKDPDPNTCIKKHYEKANELAIKYFEGECKDVHTVAGFFLLFKKSYWKQVKFQGPIMDKTGNLFDFRFVQPAFDRRMKIRIIQGVYCMHGYRILQDDWRRKDHLKSVVK